MKHLRQLVLFTLLAAVTFACKKDEDPAPLTKTDLLTAHIWRIESLTVNPPIPFEGNNGSTVTVSDLYNQYFSACVRDDIYSFRKDNRYTVEDAGTSCGDKIRFFGSWVLSSDETALVLTGGGLVTYLTDDVESWNITELTETTLKATTIIYGETVNYTVTYTFSAVQ